MSKLLAYRNNRKILPLIHKFKYNSFNITNMESIDLKLDDLEPIQIDFSEPVPTSSSSSSNFGSGIELLMNEKAKSSSHATTIVKVVQELCPKKNSQIAKYSDVLPKSRNISANKNV